MLLSRRIDKALEWVENSRIDGGICIHRTGDRIVGPYPEVTGYFIPVLTRYGKYYLAEEYAEWLVTKQLPDGGWPGANINGGYTVVGYTFDTGAVVEGLRWVSHDYYKDALLKANKFFAKVLTNDGMFVCYPGDNQYKAYNILTHAKSFIYSEPWARRMKNKDDDWPWGEDVIRTHYLAYALEGADTMSWDVEHIKDRLRDMRKPFPHAIRRGYTVADSSIDVCANFQLSAILDDKKLLEGMAQCQTVSGGFPSHLGSNQEISWAVRYFLEAAWKLTA